MKFRKAGCPSKDLCGFWFGQTNGKETCPLHQGAIGTDIENGKGFKMI